MSDSEKQTPGAIVTRPAAQCDGLIGLLQNAVFETLHWPAFVIEPITPEVDLTEPFDWLIFTSANAAHYGTRVLPMPTTGKPAVAAIGPATASALKAAHWATDLMPVDRYNSESLLALPAMQHVAGQRIRIIRGAAGRGHLAEQLTLRGADVAYIDVYQRRQPETIPTNAAAWLNAHPSPLLITSSAEALTNLVQMATPAGIDLRLLPLVAPTGRVVQLAQDMGFSAGIHASEDATDAALAQTAIRTTMRGNNGTTR